MSAALLEVPPVGVRLDAYAQRQRERGAFDWGTNNCCHFAAGWVRECEGLDAMPLLLTPDRKAALRLIQSYGGLAAAVSQQLGRAPIAPAHAAVGDVLLFKLPGGMPALGLCNGRKAFLLTPEGSLGTAPTLEAARAWRIDTSGAADRASSIPQTSAPQR